MEPKTDSREKNVWHGIIGTGQSLSCGFGGQISGQTTAAVRALKLHDTDGNYNISYPEAASLELVPLTEPLRPGTPFNDKYPENIKGMTPHHSLARTLNQMQSKYHGGNNERNYDTVHTCVGPGGAPMVLIKKEGLGNAYAASLFEAKAIARLAVQQNTEFAYDAVILTHGESDAVLNNEEYLKEVLQMQRDYASDLMSITNQRREPILILSQQNTCPPVSDLNTTVIDQMWRVQEQSEGKIICSGPKYQYMYADGIHLPAGGYNRLGEKYGQALFQNLVEEKEFRPLCPRQAKGASPQSIEVDFIVPVSPLQWDNVLPNSHQHGPHTAFKNGRGFEVYDNKGKEAEIARVTLQVDKNSVTIELSKPVQKWPVRLAYAMIQKGKGFGPGFGGGTQNGRVGHLCDSAEAELEDNILCHLESGSNVVQCLSGWQSRAVYDILEPGEHQIIEMNPSDGTKAHLNKPWNGPSGLEEMKIRHNQHNYCVSFLMEVYGTFR